MTLFCQSQQRGTKRLFPHDAKLKRHNVDSLIHSLQKTMGTFVYRIVWNNLPYIRYTCMMTGWIGLGYDPEPGNDLYLGGREKLSFAGRHLEETFRDQRLWSFWIITKFCNSHFPLKDTILSKLPVLMQQIGRHWAMCVCLHVCVRLHVHVCVRALVCLGGWLKSGRLSQGERMFLLFSWGYTKLHWCWMQDRAPKIILIFIFNVF